METYDVPYANTPVRHTGLLFLHLPQILTYDFFTTLYFSYLPCTTVGYIVGNLLSLVGVEGVVVFFFSIGQEGDVKQVIMLLRNTEI